jgi:hypothetical protein
MTICFPAAFVATNIQAGFVVPRETREVFEVGDNVEYFFQLRPVSYVLKARR